MSKLPNDDCARLSQALEAGGLTVVTYRHRQAIEGAADECRHLECLCMNGYLRLARVTGDRQDPEGERAYWFALTDKGRRLARGGIAFW